MKSNNRKSDAFTIIELIVAGAISITMLGISLSILQIGLKGNKINETQMGLSGRVNDTLDFILDEVKAGKRIINNESDITALNSNCIYPKPGDFLFGIRLPNQALVKGDYNPEGNQFSLNQIECPIVYTLRQSNNGEKMPYSLIRYGPQYNEKGYYISPSFQDFKETVLLDGVTSKAEYKKIDCPEGWNDLRTIRGISFCIDQFKKSIEIQIEVEDRQSINNNNPLKSLASTAGFSTIQDEAQINLTSSTPLSETESPSCISGGQCCWMGVCLKSNKVTYMIDRSYFMSEEYDLHPNGSIIDGEWMQSNNPSYISPRINGKSLFIYTIDSLKQHINKMPTSNTVTENKKLYLQIIAFNESSEYLFESPKELTVNNKISALSFLDSLSAEGLSINPWSDLCQALESDNVGQIILISAAVPSTIEGYCVGKVGNYPEIIDEYNRVTRSKTNIGSLVIDSISLFHNFCESSKNYADTKWLGLISSGAESLCTNIK